MLHSDSVKQERFGKGVLYLHREGGRLELLVEAFLTWRCNYRKGRILVLSVELHKGIRD